MLLDLEFIIKIAKEKIEKMKALQEDELIDPAYSWFQNDPENKKANALSKRDPRSILVLNKIFESFIKKNNINFKSERKILCKKNFKTKPTLWFYWEKINTLSRTKGLL